MSCTLSVYISTGYVAKEEDINLHALAYRMGNKYTSDDVDELIDMATIDLGFHIGVYGDFTGGNRIVFFGAEPVKVAEGTWDFSPAVEAPVSGYATFEARKVYTDVVGRVPDPVATYALCALF